MKNIVKYMILIINKCYKNWQKMKKIMEKKFRKKIIKKN